MIKETSRTITRRMDEVPDDIYFYPQISSLENPMRMALRRILPQILNGQYSLLVGDDTSGRIPTLAWRKVINFAYANKDFKPISTVFIQVETNMPTIQSYLPKDIQDKIAISITEAKTQTKTRALISTEYITSGRHIQMIGRFLDYHKMPYDVISVHTDQGRVWNQTHFGTNVFSSFTPGIPEICGQEDLTGLRSGRNSDRPKKGLVMRGKEATKRIELARKDTNLLAQNLIEVVDEELLSQSYSRG